MSAAFREEFADVFEDAKQAAQALQEVGRTCIFGGGAGVV